MGVFTLIYSPLVEYYSDKDGFINLLFLWPAVITSKKIIITANVDDKLVMRKIEVFLNFMNSH